MKGLDFYNKHYVAVNEHGFITNGFSDAFHQPSDTDICINDKGGYQFRLFPDGEENPALYDWEHTIPLYKYEDGAVIRRTEEEIEADIAAIPVTPVVPTTEERVAALEDALAQTDEAAIELYEAQAAQEEINAAQDEALIELYEMIGG